jgi:hypothetical protein
MTTDPTGANLVLIVGCPRSGTTWLQRMLAQHDLVRTGQESHVFNYLAPLLQRWRGDLENGGTRPAGLGCYMDEDGFSASVRRFADELLRPLTGRLVSGELFVEKTPSHARCLPEILELMPQVRVIHMQRDPRDVVASLLAASSSWAAGWAPKSARAAAAKWLAYSRAVRRAKSLFEPGRFLETSYEAMQRDAAAELRRCLEFMRLPFDEEFVRWAVDTNRQGGAKKPLPLPAHGTAAGIPLGGEVALRQGRSTVEEPAGFIRRAESGGWRQDLSLGQKLVVWRALHREMELHGYAWPPSYRLLSPLDWRFSLRRSPKAIVGRP